MKLSEIEKKEMTIETLTAKANELVKNEPRTMAHKVGTYGRQGDIYIHPVNKNHPRGKETTNHQLAIGEGQGSRHILVGDVKLWEGTTAPKGVASATFLGQLFEVGEKGATITHPEHAHVVLKDAGCYQISHQVDARTLARVRD